MPSRIDSLRIALPHILSQVDRLYLYFDKYQEVPPEFKAEPKIVSLLPAEEGLSLGGTGKFQGLRLISDPCIYFCFDDDIIYPSGYVDYLASALRRHHYRALVGIHGAVYKFPITSYARDRVVLHFQLGSHFDVLVDELGTGTLAFHSSCIHVNHDKWLSSNMSDLNIMIEAVRQKVPRICVRRSPNYLQPISQDQSDSLYRASLIDDSVQTSLLQAAMRHYPDSWSLSS